MTSSKSSPTASGRRRKKRRNSQEDRLGLFSEAEMLFLAQKGDERVSAEELSRRLRIPYPFLRTMS
jgi:hypothetical protein